MNNVRILYFLPFWGENSHWIDTQSMARREGKYEASLSKDLQCDQDGSLLFVFVTVAVDTHPLPLIE